MWGCGQWAKSDFTCLGVVGVIAMGEVHACHVHASSDKLGQGLNCLSLGANGADEFGVHRAACWRKGTLLLEVNGEVVLECRACTTPALTEKSQSNAVTQSSSAALKSGCRCTKRASAALCSGFRTPHPKAKHLLVLVDRSREVLSAIGLRRDELCSSLAPQIAPELQHARRRRRRAHGRRGGRGHKCRHAGEHRVMPCHEACVLSVYGCRVCTCAEYQYAATNGQTRAITSQHFILVLCSGRDWEQPRGSLRAKGRLSAARGSLTRAAREWIVHGASRLHTSMICRCKTQQLCRTLLGQLLCFPGRETYKSRPSEKQSRENLSSLIAYTLIFRLWVN